MLHEAKQASVGLSEVYKNLPHKTYLLHNITCHKLSKQAFDYSSGYYNYMHTTHYIDFLHIYLLIIILNSQ